MQSLNNLIIINYKTETSFHLKYFEYWGGMVVGPAYLFDLHLLNRFREFSKNQFPHTNYPHFLTVTANCMLE